MDNTEEYIPKCEQAEDIQKNWTPEVGDYIWRKFTVFGEEIDKQVWNEDKRQEIIILHSKSSIEGTYHATAKDGGSRIFSNYEDIVKATSIWLPRQDQLQKMVGNMNYDITFRRRGKGSKKKEGKYVAWIRKHSSGEEQQEYMLNETTTLVSMEQLWLNFVMREKYNKTWNGKIWEEISSGY